MEATEIKNIVNSQRHFFLTGKTLDIHVRIEALKKLRNAILKHENDIYEAREKDLGKSRFESYMCEVGLTLSEITYMLKNLETLKMQAL